MSTTTEPETKDRITCHVLDTTTGAPARNLRVKLELTSAPSSTKTVAVATAPAVFESQTDEDGRIKTWLPYSSPTSSGEVPVYTLGDVLGGIEQGNGVINGNGNGNGNGGGDGTGTGTGDSSSVWTLRFDTAGYFGGADKTFYPEVGVTFSVRAGERYHVPLLLAPYGYSTYRGS